MRTAAIVAMVFTIGVCSQARAWSGSDLLAIDSTPDGADVYLDGELVGVTPLRVPVPCDQIKVRRYRIAYRDCNAMATTRSDGRPPSRPATWRSVC